MDEERLQEIEERCALRGPKWPLELCAEIRRLRMLLAPPVTAGNAVALDVQRLQPVSEAGEIGEAWSSG